MTKLIALTIKAQIPIVVRMHAKARIPAINKQATQERDKNLHSSTMCLRPRQENTNRILSPLQSLWLRITVHIYIYREARLS